MLRASSAYSTPDPKVVNASLKYECNRYVDGKYEGFIMMIADNKAQAEKKAYDKYKQMGHKVHSVKCK